MPAERDERPVVIVSACLLGVRCNHEGRANPSAAVAALATSHRLVPVCPEVAGGLGTPRPAAERQADGTVRTADGTDVTECYRRGAEQAVALVAATGARLAVLKARSPSCGSDCIRDGSFTGALVPGEGVTAGALRAVGVEVVSDERLVDRTTS